jgi:GntR family transcriptional regulator/MocR family aminotransferase
VVYRARRDELLAAAASAGLTIRAGDAGLHAVCDLPRGGDPRVIAATARERGVEVLPLAAFQARGRAAPALVVGFGVAAPRRIRSAMAILGEIITGMRRSRARVR